MVPQSRGQHPNFVLRLLDALDLIENSSMSLISSQPMTISHLFLNLGIEIFTLQIHFTP